MGGRLLDWLGAGAAGDIPDPVTDMPSRIVSNSVALYFATDTKHLFIYDQSGPSWYDVDLPTLAGFSTESIQDMIAAFLDPGSGINLSYNDAGNLLTITCTVTQYTDEMAQDAIAALIAAGTDTGLSIVYNDAGNLVSFTVNVASASEIWAGTVNDKFITPLRLKDWRTPVALTDGATITLDGSLGVNFYVTLGGNRTFANPTNFSPGQFGVVYIAQDSTGNRTGTFGSNFKFEGISLNSNVLSTTGSAVDELHYYVRTDGTISCRLLKGLTGSPVKLKLSDISDVAISSPANGDVLTYDSGTSKWKNAAPSGGSGGVPIHAVNAPTLSFSTWVNQGTATKTTQANGVITVISSLGDGSTENIAGVFASLPATPYSYLFGFIPTLQGVNFQGCGFALRESSSGKLILFSAYREAAGTMLWYIANYNSPTSKNANISVPASQWGHNGPTYLKIADDGTTRTASFGWDPYYQPFSVYSVSHTSFITADQIGIVTDNVNSTNRCGISVFSQT